MRKIKTIAKRRKEVVVALVPEARGGAVKPLSLSLRHQNYTGISLTWDRYEQESLRSKSARSGNIVSRLSRSGELLFFPLISLFLPSSQYNKESERCCSISLPSVPFSLSG